MRRKAHFVAATNAKTPVKLLFFSFFSWRLCFWECLAVQYEFKKFLVHVKAKADRLEWDFWSKLQLSLNREPPIANTTGVKFPWDSGRVCFLPFSQTLYLRILNILFGLNRCKIFRPTFFPNFFNSSSSFWNVKRKIQFCHFLTPVLKIIRNVLSFSPSFYYWQWRTSLSEDNQITILDQVRDWVIEVQLSWNPASQNWFGLSKSVQAIHLWDFLNGLFWLCFLPLLNTCFPK